MSDTTNQKKDEPMETDKPKKHPGGRPTIYKPEYAEMLLQYVDKKAYEVTEVIIRGKNWEKTDTKLTPCDLPTLEEFAWQIGTTPQTLWEWQASHPEFGDAYARAKAKIKVLLIQGGLSGVYDSKFAGLVAINLTDMRNKVDVDIPQLPKQGDLPAGDVELLRSALAEMRRRKMLPDKT